MPSNPNLPNTMPEAAFADYLKDGAAPGCSVAASEALTLSSFSIGKYDTTNSPDVQPSTPYDLASITKLFTAALVLRQHEAGNLTVNDRCSDYLDNFSRSNVRIIDLLTHRVDFNIFLSEYRNRYPTKELLTDAFMNLTPPADPSEGVYYGNIGYFYLGKIIEDVSGKDLSDNMHGLFEALDLNETYTGIDVAQQHIATPATENSDGDTIRSMTHDETARILGGLAGNAGVFSSARDLNKFGRSWLNGLVIESDELKSALAENHDRSGLKPQSIGWWMRYSSPEGEVPTHGILSHTGYTGSMIVINPANEKVAALTCNRTFYGRDNMSQRKIWSLLIDWVKKDD